MADGKPPRVLVINYNEDGDYASEHEKEKNQILSKIGNYESTNPPKEPWDFIILCTQKSLSSTEDHMQHVIGDILTKNKNPIYELFSKLDATRKANSSFMRITKDSKFRNVRVRCWKLKQIHTPPKMVYLSKESYHTSPNSYENSLYNFQADDNDIDDKTPNKVNIIKYNYRRCTNSEDNPNIRKQGDGAIIINIGLKKNGAYYEYIICNYDSPKILLDSYIIPTNNSQESKKELSDIKNRAEKPFRNLGQNMIKRNSMTSMENIFISYISTNSIIYKYIKKEEVTNNKNPPIYNLLWNKTKRVRTNNSKTTHGLTFEQIGDNYHKVRSSGDSVGLTSNNNSIENLIISLEQNKFMRINESQSENVNNYVFNLEQTIYTILSYHITNKIEITVSNINKYMKDISPNKKYFNYNDILKILNALVTIKTFKNTFDFENISIYLKLWEKIDSFSLTKNLNIKSLYNKYNKNGKFTRFKSF
jgi:hypothetical protein